MAKEREEKKTSWVRKALGARLGSAAGSFAHDADLATACPALHEFLTAVKDDEGKPRQPSTLLVFTEGGLWKCVLNERDAGLALWATADTLAGLWMELEARLTAPSVEWRAQKPRPQAKGR